MLSAEQLFPKIVHLVASGPNCDLLNSHPPFSRAGGILHKTA
jgi:hypothetical protein